MGAAGPMPSWWSGGRREDPRDISSKGRGHLVSLADRGFTESFLPIVRVPGEGAVLVNRAGFLVTSANRKAAPDNRKGYPSFQYMGKVHCVISANLIVLVHQGGFRW